MIILFLGNHANIPDGWQRETALDGYFIKGWGNEAPNTTGGSAQHSHTSPTHTHTVNHHTHTFATNWSNGENAQDCANPVCNDFAHNSHQHVNHVVDTTDNGNLSSAVTYANTTWEPTHQRLIFIKPSASNMPVPVGGILLYDKTSAPINYDYEITMDGKFIKGADTGANPIQAGSDTHSHDISHTHPTVAHSHTGRAWYTNQNDTRQASSWSSQNKHASHYNHTHTVYFSNANLTSSAYSGNAGSADTGIEPLHKKIRAIKNVQAGAMAVPLNAIVLSLTLTVAPRNWKMKTELQNVFIKITNNNGLILQQAGSNTHGHAPSNSHTHTDTTGAHTHTATTSGGSADGETGAGSQSAAGSGHTHNVINIGTNTASWGNTTVQADNTTWQPPYKTVSFLELIKIERGGAFLQNFV